LQNLWFVESWYYLPHKQKPPRKRAVLLKDGTLSIS